MKGFLIRNYGILGAEADVFLSSFEDKHYNKGDKFISYGQKCDKVGFVKKGLLKCTIRGTEKSVIDDFVFEHQFVANYYSFLKQEKSNKEISCLKDSVISVISRKRLLELADNHPFVERMSRKVSEQLFITTAKKLEDIKLLNAEERYLQLLKMNNRIVNEIPQYEVASYLNVTPETVSRIRNKLALRS